MQWRPWCPALVALLIACSGPEERHDAAPDPSSVWQPPVDRPTQTTTPRPSPLPRDMERPQPVTSGGSDLLENRAIRFDQQIAITTGRGNPKVVNSRLYVQGDRIRRDDFEDPTSGRPVSTTLLLPDRTITLDHRRKTYLAINARLDVNDPTECVFKRDFKDLRKWRMTGHEDVDGHPCEVWERGMGDRGLPSSQAPALGEKAWFATDLTGFLIRFQNQAMLGLGTAMRRGNFEVAPVEDLFRVPDDYQPQALPSKRE